MEEEVKQAHPALHRYLFTVTTFSKLLAAILFIVLPFIGFYLGMRYQQKLIINQTNAPEAKVVILTPTLSPAPTPITTTTWKTYTNKVFKFSFDYPSYLTLYKDNLVDTKQTGSINDEVRFTPNDKTFTPDLRISANPRFGGTCAADILYTINFINNQVSFTKEYTQKLPLCENSPPFFSGIMKLSDELTILITFGYEKNDTGRNYEADFDKLLQSFQSI